MSGRGGFAALRAKARRGSRGYPAATIAYYGPDDRRASKVAVAVLMAAKEDPAVVERWPTCPSCPYWADKDRWTGETIR
jgi:hypothetical protein